MANLPSIWNAPGSEPIIVKEILHKFLSTGARASVALVRTSAEYQAVLYINGRRIRGLPAPQPLDVPRGELTHWMGNKPAVGLTRAEAEAILWEINEWTRRTGKK